MNLHTGIIWCIMCLFSVLFGGFAYIYAIFIWSFEPKQHRNWSVISTLYADDDTQKECFRTIKDTHFSSFSVFKKFDICLKIVSHPALLLWLIHTHTRTRPFASLTFVDFEVFLFFLDDFSKVQYHFIHVANCGANWIFRASRRQRGWN